MSYADGRVAREYAELDRVLDTERADEPRQEPALLWRDLLQRGQIGVAHKGNCV